MAGVLRRLKPSLAPTGRVIQLRELVAGNPRESKLVEVRLGCREDKADYPKGSCLARQKRTFDQCGRVPPEVRWCVVNTAAAIGSGNKMGAACHRRTPVA